MQLCVTTPVQSVYKVELVVKNCPVVIQDRMFIADLVVLEIQGYDIILGMDWLTMDKVTIDCEQKNVTLVTPEGERLVHRGVNSKPVILLISANRGYKLLKKGCPACLCVVEAVRTQELDPKEIPIVQEFLRII